MSDNIFDMFQEILTMLQSDDWRDAVGNDVVDGYTVDTQLTACHGYETGIKLGEGPLVIVERYADKESAKAGHDKWVSVCVEAHPAKLWSVQSETFEDLLITEENKQC